MKVSYYLLFISVLLTTTLNAQVGEVCKWKSGKKAAVVLTFDDWTPGHYPIVVPELHKRGLTATFYPMISSIEARDSNWANTKEAISHGNEIGNHSLNHPGLPGLESDSLGVEIRKAMDIFNTNLPMQTILTFDYPYGAYSDQVIDSVMSTGHIAARGVNSTTEYSYDFAKNNRDYFTLQCVAMGSKTSTEEFANHLDKVIEGGGLLIYMYHSVDDAEGTYNDNWYETVLSDSLHDQLNALLALSNDLWVTTLAEAIKYHREANCAKIEEVKPFNGKKMVISLTDTLTNNSVYNQPLSLKIKSNGVQFESVMQNKSAIPFEFTENNEYILFEAIPDMGNISISK